MTITGLVATRVQVAVHVQTAVIAAVRAVQEADQYRLR